MDRQAWIAVTLCVLGLIGWQVYMTTHAPRMAPVVAARPSPSAVASPTPVGAAAPSVASTAATPAPGAVDQTPSPASESTPSFEEKVETLANADVELQLTNRGGAIAEARLLHHKGEHGQGSIVLNSPERLPIGALMEEPGTAALPEFTVARQPDGSVEFT